MPRPRSIRPVRRLLGCALAVLLLPRLLGAQPQPVPDDVGPVFPGKSWDTRTPAEVGLDAVLLDSVRAYLGGRGVVVRHGYLAYSWGDAAAPGDVASAAKPWYAHFLFRAVEVGRLEGLDAPVVPFEPRLAALNAELGHKDRALTFRHLATQTACYGVQERPGTAFDYTDWGMALFWDVLFGKVYGAPYATVDSLVLHPILTGPLDCEDAPSFMAFGTADRPGRLSVSPRDFARFGLLYLREGNWNGRQLISREHARRAVREPLPLTIPRTAGRAAEMIPGQRTIGSQRVPDDQTDHHGSYSWLWWVNGVGRDGRRLWPDAPDRVFACLGHGARRGMAVVPALDLVLSWNDAELDRHPADPHPLNAVFRLLAAAAR